MRKTLRRPTLTVFLFSPVLLGHHNRQQTRPPVREQVGPFCVRIPLPDSEVWISRESVRASGARPNLKPCRRNLVQTVVGRRDEARTPANALYRAGPSSLTLVPFRVPFSPFRTAKQDNELTKKIRSQVSIT